jgi:acyl-CoA dehydrogenase
MLNKLFSEHTLFKESVEKYVTTKLEPNVTLWEANNFFPNEVFQELGSQGYLGILISEKYGGIGGDYLLASAWCDAFGTLSSVGLTTAVNMHSLVIAHAVEKYGSELAKERFLPDSLQGNLIGAYAFTEPDAGSDLANIKTSAKQDGDYWIINGSKTFITNGVRADYVLLLTKNDSSAGYKGFTTFIVDTKLPGFSVSKKLDKLGWRCSDTAELRFEDVRIHKDYILGQIGEGWIQASNNLNWERLMLSILSFSGARTCYKSAYKYTTERKAFGKYLNQLSGVRNLLETMQTKLLLSEALLAKTIYIFNTGSPCRKEVALTKRKICEDAIWIADKCIQIHGGYGYTKEFSAERWWRDLRLMTLGGGTSEIMGNIVLKEMF